VFGSGPAGEAWVRFTPRNSEAAPMTVHYSTTDVDAEPLLDVADFVADPGDLDDVIDLMRAIVARGARVVEGKGRTGLEVSCAEDRLYVATAYDIGVLVPAFLWRRKPSVRCYEPYE
jgi:hypothetical protein